MKRRHAIICALLVIAAPYASAGQNEPATPNTGPEHTEAFQMAYGLMSLGLDGCGETNLAALFRRALEAKVAACPFSDRAKAEFTALTKQFLALEAAQFKSIIEKNGKLPGKLWGTNETCEHWRMSPKFAETRKKLEAYAQHKIGVDEVIPEPCFVPAVPL